MLVSSVMNISSSKGVTYSGYLLMSELVIMENANRES